MFRMGQRLLTLALVLSPAALPNPASATILVHTWVASAAAGGNDSNNCDIAHPCADIYTAYQNTTAGGEITCLNSGDFGDASVDLSITKSITINCEGAVGSASTAAGGVQIQLLFVEISAGDVVVLRGLDFDLAGQGECLGGGGTIEFQGAGVLHIQKSKISHSGECSGVYFEATGPAELDISDSDITDNGTSGTMAGVSIVPNSGAAAQVSIDHSHINNNYYGVVADGRNGGTIQATISDSVVSGNTENGITALSSGSSVVVMVDQTKVSGNLAGLFAGGSNTGILARNTTVFSNTVGLDTTGGGTLYTYGNNSVNGNTTNGAFTGTVALQ